MFNYESSIWILVVEGNELNKSTLIPLLRKVCSVLYIKQLLCE